MLRQMLHLPKYSLTVKHVTKNDSSNGIVYLQVIVDRKRLMKTTGVNCDASNFNSAANDFRYVEKKDRNWLYKNQQIRESYLEVEAAILSVIKQYNRFDIVLAKIALENKYSKADTLLDYAIKYLGKSGLSSKTIARYTHIINANIKPMFSNVTLIEVTTTWLMSFESYLRNQKKTTGKPMYEGNTIWSILKFVRSVLNYAMDNGVDLSYPFGNKRGLYKMPEYKNPDRDYLSDEQIEIIKTYYSHSEALLRNVSKWFVLQCYLGCRFSDLVNFSLDKIKDNRYYITDVKTKNQHYVPLYPELIEAINEAPSIVMYSYNVYLVNLKRIGLEMGLPFKLTTHTARHSFCTRWLNRGGSYEALKPIVGITLDKTVRIYGKITNNRIDDEANRILG
jgi:integrase/recombinase XerD